MTREVTIFSNPVAAPGVCAKCGSQDKDWFVDLGFELEMHKYEPSIGLTTWFDGVVYLCCDCINNLIYDIDRKFPIFKDDHYVTTGFNGEPASITFDGDDSESEPDYSGADEASGPNEFSIAFSAE